MGRLIDENDLMDLLYTLNDARHELFYAIKKVSELPPVEAIPKDQYEARLKADMVAMLTDIQLEIEESENCGKAFHLGLQMANNIIQQKINELEGKISNE